MFPSVASIARFAMVAGKPAPDFSLDSAGFGMEDQRMRPARPLRFPGTEEDLVRLGKLLRLGLRASGWSVPPRPTVLNLACGRADETGILIEALAPAGAPLFLLGIDLRGPEIDEARARWLPSCQPGQSLDFRCGDASRVDRMRQLPSFDFVFIRHQNFWHDPEVWTRLYRHALGALKPDGRLAITSYFDREHELATECLRQLGAKVLADLPHPASRPLGDAPGKSVDRHLAILAQSL
jgi:SAM-dependent methyltransferase